MQQRIGLGNCRGAKESLEIEHGEIHAKTDLVCVRELGRTDREEMLGSFRQNCCWARSQSPSVGSVFPCGIGNTDFTLSSRGEQEKLRSKMDQRSFRKQSHDFGGSLVVLAC